LSLSQFDSKEELSDFIQRYEQEHDPAKKAWEQFRKYPKITTFVNTGLLISRNIPGGLGVVLNTLKRFDRSEGKGLSKFVDWVLDNREGPYETFDRLFKSDPGYVRTFLYNFILRSGAEWQSKAEEQIKRGEFQAPFTLLVNPSWRCNMDCNICWAKSYNRDDKGLVKKVNDRRKSAVEMEPEFLDDILTQAEEVGTHFFTILGGEPSLLFRRPGYREAFLNHPESEFQFFTNGTMIDDYTIDYLKINKNMIPVFSIDGFEKETDEMRGKGAYEKVTAGMERLKDEKIPFGVSLVLTNRNYDALTSLKFNDWLVDKGAMFGWTFVCMPVGLFPSLDDMPTGEQRLNYGRFIKEYRENNPLFVIDFWNDAPAVKGCIAARKYAQVVPSGYLEPCVFAHFATHNLHDVSLKEAWNSSYFNDIRLHQPVDENLLRPCMIIDFPYILREHYEKHRPEVTDNTSQEIVTGLSGELDKYAENVGRVLNKAWEESEERKKHEEFIERTGRGTGEGFDRIWLENLPEDERMKALEKAKPERR
jgi:MoaA/NifB/PqqE/SkfB family radical SAM enzyme